MTSRIRSGHDAADCRKCDAVCCRLTVVLQPGDRVPPHLTARTDAGLLVMAHDEEGWCVALDGARMNCGIYETRPDVCRRFVMGGPYCNAVRAEYADHREHVIGDRRREIELILQ